MKLQQSRGAVIILENSKKVFVIRHFRSHGGLYCRESKKVMGARESPLHVTSFLHDSFQARTTRLGLQQYLLQKKTLCFVVITDSFQKINPHLKATQATAVFNLRNKKNTWNKWGAFYCQKLTKLLITWATSVTSVFYFLGLSWAKRLTWTTKIFHGQPNQVLGQLDIKVNFELWFHLPALVGKIQFWFSLRWQLQLSLPWVCIMLLPLMKQFPL